jgi:hypothetical protein
MVMEVFFKRVVRAIVGRRDTQDGLGLLGLTLRANIPCERRFWSISETILEDAEASRQNIVSFIMN